MTGVQGSLFQPADDGPLVLSYGVGVDSTAILVGWHQRGIRPDLILFADPGSEHRRTYAYLPMIREWLASVGFPDVTTVRYRPAHGRYESILDECLLKMVLPSLAFGSKSCSQKHKVEPQRRYLASWPPAVRAWSRGARIRNAIGYDAGPKDALRGRENVDTDLTRFTFPLREWGWDRDRCEAEIAGCAEIATIAARHGIPVSPGHSACVCCPATRPCEILDMASEEPEELAAALSMEAAALPHLTKLQGLWRKPSADRPAAWNQFVAEHAPHLAAAAPDAAGQALKRHAGSLPPPPDGMRYAVSGAGGTKFHAGFGEAVKDAAGSTLHAWIGGAWYDNEERREG